MTPRPQMPLLIIVTLLMLAGCDQRADVEIYTTQGDQCQWAVTREHDGFWYIHERKPYSIERRVNETGQQVCGSKKP